MLRSAFLGSGLSEVQASFRRTRIRRKDLAHGTLRTALPADRWTPIAGYDRWTGAGCGRRIKKCAPQIIRAGMKASDLYGWNANSVAALAEHAPSVAKGSYLRSQLIFVSVSLFVPARFGRKQPVRRPTMLTLPGRI